MNRILKSRTIRIPCSVVAPPSEELVLPALSAGEGSQVEGTVAERPPLRQAERLALSEVEAARPTPRKPVPRPSTALRLNSAEEPALREAKGSEACRLRPKRICELEGARSPHPGRHTRKRSICCHPDRDAIEEDFIHWHSPSDIVIDYHVPDRSSVYRHAHATGLFARRSRNLRFVLENLLERVDKVKVTAHAVVRAVRAYTRISDRGEWVEPPRRIIVSSGSSPAAPALPDCTERHERVPGKATGRSVLIATRGHSRDEPTR